MSWEEPLQYMSPKFLEVASRLVDDAEVLLRKTGAIKSGEDATKVFDKFERVFVTDNKYVEKTETVLFSNDKAIRREGDALRVLDVQPIKANRPIDERFVLYDKSQHGNGMLVSIRSLNLVPDVENPFRQVYPDAMLIARRIIGRGGATESFMDQAVPAGSIPIGYGGDRFAFGMKTGDVALLGTPSFRPPVPDMLFPTSRLEAKGVQVERLPRVEPGTITSDGLMNLRDASDRAGFHFYDRQSINAGLLDGQAKILDMGAVVRNPNIDKQFGAVEHGEALAELRRGLNEATMRQGKDAHPTGAFHSEVGFHHLRLGDMQSAEEHLNLGINSMTAHQDWDMVATTAERLQEFYAKSKNPIQAKAFDEMKTNAAERFKDWKAMNAKFDLLR